MRHALVLLIGLSTLAATGKGCSCRPSEECQLIRALCRADICRKTDPAGWSACEAISGGCDSIETSCISHGECLEAFLERCTARMVPGAFAYGDYAHCASLDCLPNPAPPPPDAASVTDAGTRRDAAVPPPPPPTCAGVLCDGSCCTAYPCFSGGHCICVGSVADCMASEPGGDPPPLTPSCCSDAPLCSAQGKLCCFVPPTGSLPAQTRCLSSCAEARHCVFAPYLQADGMSSCLPAPYDEASASCPF